MEKELTEVYCGNGKGKTALAIGQSLRVATQGKRRDRDPVSERKRPAFAGFPAGCGQPGF